MTDITINSYQIIKQTLQKYLCSGTYTQDVHHILASCRQSDINLYMTIIGLGTVKNTLYVKYITGVCTDCVIRKSTLSFDFRSIQSYDMYFYHTESLKELIDCKKEYIFRHIHCNIKGKKHVMMLIIDKKNHKITLFDPNYDSLLTTLIEQIITHAVNKFNMVYHDNYLVEYVAYEELNKLNRFSSPEIDGLCVSLTLIVSHFTSLTKFSLRQSILMFSSLTNEQLITIIRSYSLFFYVCCHKI